MSTKQNKKKFDRIMMIMICMKLAKINDFFWKKTTGISISFFPQKHYHHLHKITYWIQMNDFNRSFNLGKKKADFFQKMFSKEIWSAFCIDLHTEKNNNNNKTKRCSCWRQVTIMIPFNDNNSNSLIKKGKKILIY